jgi:hypothetical protein
MQVLGSPMHVFTICSLYLQLEMKNASHRLSFMEVSPFLCSFFLDANVLIPVFKLYKMPLLICQNEHILSHA